MNLEEQLRNAKDRDELHRMIDALPDGGCIILVSNRCLDPDCENRGDPEHDDTHTLMWKAAGSILVYQAVGLLEMTKVDIVTAEYDDDQE